MSVTFTVICPTYNRSVRLIPTLRSVLAQTVADLELLVLSDGSDDDTVEVAQSLDDDRVRVIPLGRTGHPSGPRQEGLRRARGEFVAYIDHDDLWRPDHLAQLSTLLHDGDLAATGYQAVDGSGAVTRRSGWWDLCWHPELQVLDPLFEPSRIAHRRGLPESVGGWTVTPGLEDWDLLLRLTDAGHQVRTTTARTATIFEDVVTRRYQVGARHFVPLFETPDARLARRIRDALATPEMQEALASAAQADSERRIDRLLRSPSLVRPSLSADVPSPEPVASFDGRGPVPLIVPIKGRYTVALPVFCSSAEHARRIGSLLEEHAGEQLRLIRSLASSASGAARSA